MQNTFQPDNPKSRSELPQTNEYISAGFPSPAEEYIEPGIDLNEHLIKNPISTFFLRVKGNSMKNIGIQNNDLLIVDRSIDAKPGHIVIAIIDGEFILKKLSKSKDKYYLESEDSNYPKIDISQYINLQIWGVAIYSIHNLKN